MNPGNFFAELKRRNVYKVAVAYAVVAWLLIQITTQVFPFLEIPRWAIRLVILLVVLGFPVALVLAWAYELTPEGIKRAEDVAPNGSITRRTGRKLDFLIIAVLLVAIGALLYQRLYPKSATVSEVLSEKSIAVLPFANLSSDNENAYFAAGIQDEILTRLSKIAALKVISRTSTQKYASAPDNLREVGKQLGAAHLLEGSVQRVGNATHISVQLIRAATDEHLWAESYNRNLDDIFEVEGEVAGAIAAQLNARLSGAEKKELKAKPTKNPEAHEAYLRGLAFLERPDLIENDLKSAIESFETAVRLDPNFALAWARLSNAHSVEFFEDDASAARRAAAQQALQKAVQLQPDLIETELAEAYFHYLTERDYERARLIFEQLHLKSPNDSQIPLALALIARRQGRWEESLARFHEAIELDPRNVKALMWIAETYTALRQFPAALKFIDRALDIAPADAAALARKVAIYQAIGQLGQAEQVLGVLHMGERDAESLGPVIDQLILQRRHPAAIELVQSWLARLEPGQAFERAQVLLYLGDLQRMMGDEQNARRSYAESRGLIEAGLRSQPDNADYISHLALIDAGLGERDAAIREAEQAMQLLPASKDAIEGPYYESILATVLARFGERERAITALEHLLAVPYLANVPITPALLRLEPAWDNLRGDPRFEKLLGDDAPLEKR